jgi:hypothetical protein
VASFSFVFVAHGGELEVKAGFLAASLAKYLACDYELVAAVPKPESTWGALSKPAVSLFERLQVRVEEIENGIGADYPIGNKIAAIGVPCRYQRVIFLDSDMLLMRPFFDHPLLARACAAKSADVDTFSHSGGRWSTIYRLFDQPLPQQRIVASFTGELMMPYFNAGFILTKQNQRFSELWLETSKRIDKAPTVTNKRPWLDQIALPVTAELAGTPINELNEDFNFPAHNKDVDKHSTPYFCHYHWPSVIEKSSKLRDQLKALIGQHGELKELAQNHENWQALL